MFHNGQVINRKDAFVVAFDVDHTLLDSVNTWLAHFGIKEEDLPEIAEGECYDLVPWLRDNKQLAHDECPLEWWKQGGLYQNVQPFPGVQEFLKEFRKQLEFAFEKEVVFILVSSCFPEHEKSKWDRMEELFPGEFEAKISTSAKHHVDFDILFDDSTGVALNCNDAGKPVIMPHGKLNPLSIHKRELNYVCKVKDIWSIAPCDMVEVVKVMTTKI